jgi:uncharacterized pyridoxamine 5'-phosphate oxidase family protein
LDEKGAHGVGGGMNMIELLTAIALWCGNVNDQSNSVTRVSTKTVNDCREKLYFCTTEINMKSGFRVMKNDGEIVTCFGKQQL